MAKEPLQTDQECSSISLRDFLEKIPPGEPRQITKLIYNPGGRNAPQVVLPEVELHCTSARCSGNRAFKAHRNDWFHSTGPHYAFWTFTCRNCGNQSKTYAVLIQLHDIPKKDREWAGGDLFKLGEVPQFGDPLPKRLLSLVEDDKNAFIKGWRAERRGLGIGTHSLRPPK